MTDIESIKYRVINTKDPEYTEVLNLRHQILRAPLGLDLFKEDLSQETEFIFLVAVDSSPLILMENETVDKTKIPAKVEPRYKKEKVVGCLGLAPYDKDSFTLTLRQMAVSKEYQGKGLGKELVKRAEIYTKEQGKKRIWLRGRQSAVDFYLKCGFQIMDKKLYFETTVLDMPYFVLDKVLL